MVEFISSPAGIAVIIGTILVSLTLHEAMHAFTAHWLGDDTAYLQGRLTLNPLKHIDPFLTIGMPVLLALMGAPVLGAAKPVPFNPFRVRFEEYGAALVAIAGPLTNLVLAIAAAFIFRAVGPMLPEILLMGLLTFIIVNIGFFVFNMIPFPPLDGSRALYAVAPEPVQKFMTQIESFGLFGFFIFFFLGFPYIAPLLGTWIDTIYRLLLGA
ncbi:MAG: site-2 protease family protein [Candidatus Saccharibacteria bacterium]|nr:site-2 protease family protein [Candidatus Saccharibacteria bacterium]